MKSTVFSRFSAPALFFACFASASSGATLQIASDAPPTWDSTSATQTGTVGSTRVEATTTRLPWNPTFTDENSIGYTREAYFGTLALPSGTFGDAFNQVVRPGNMFDLTIRFLDSIIDPIFYILDIDLVGASVSFAGGWDTVHVSDDGTLLGNTITANSGVLQETPGAHAAIRYLGEFAPGATFNFAWDFSAVETTGGENIALGIGTFESGGNPPPPPSPPVVPLPASGLMLASVLAGLGAVRSWPRARAFQRRRS